ncbi:hypothetical protein [Amorphus sp. 3PC139-8]|uniref:hypothetical protein n=1 Tax=Amorphus sp. 3PC139-8 TaxID=2735676 RepID=UPI00345D8599
MRGEPGQADPAGAGCRADREELSRKLRLTALALGCATNKELCARFATVNPNTAFTAQNAYKWVGGKATPRLSSVYEDWARVLGEDLTASFVAAASFKEFAAAVQERHPLPEAALARLERDRVEGRAVPLDPATPAPEPRTQPLWQSNHLLCGGYLAMSYAWSRAETGNLILGRMEVEARPDGGLDASYTEKLFGRLVPMMGQVSGDGRAAQAVLRCSFSGRLYFLALQVPSPPANLVGGILVGSALHDPNARALAGRMLLVRDRSVGQLSGGLGYLPPDPARLDGEIARLGYADTPERQAASQALIDFLDRAPEVPMHQDVPQEAVLELAIAFDRLEVAAAPPVRIVTSR